MGKMVKDFSDLFIYKSAYEAAMLIYKSSKTWPREERYALTDQIRRSSRAVCANLAEAWAKRRYEAHFVQKLSDAEAEAAETVNWLKFATDCGYLSSDVSAELARRYRAIRAGLVTMMKEKERWCGPASLRDPGAEYGHDGIRH